MLNPKQIAASAGVSVQLVYAWCAAGVLKHFRLGTPGRRGKIVIDERDWVAFLESRSVGTTTATPFASTPPTLKHLKLPIPESAGCNTRAPGSGSVDGTV